MKCFEQDVTQCSGDIVAGQVARKVELNSTFGNGSCKLPCNLSRNNFGRCRVCYTVKCFVQLVLLEKCVLTILELNWNQRLGHKKTKLNICHHMLTSSTQLQNRSFLVVERTRTSSKCQKMKNARAKRAKYQICKFVEFLLLSSSWLLRLPNVPLFERR